MKTINNVHQQFADFFEDRTLEPFAYLISKKLSEGHICLPLQNLEEDLVTTPYHVADSAVIVRQLHNNYFVTGLSADKPFVLHNNKLYLQRYFKYETTILQCIKFFVQHEQAVQEERMQQLQQNTNLVETLFAGDTAQNDTFPWQRIAALLATLQNFTIITGGPGTGKTTTVAKILAILLNSDPGLKVALAAPTGKAAKRMAESLQKALPGLGLQVQQALKLLEPSTIHKLLKPVSGTPYFKYNKLNPLPYQVVIIDEASMIDAALFAKLLDAIAGNTKLIVLGDKDQLASVEAGSFFGDLCSANVFEVLPRVASFVQQFLPAGISLPVAKPANANLLSGHIVELKTSHRFTGHTGIGKFSKAIIQNNAADLQQFLKNTDTQVVVDTAYSDTFFEEFIQAYSDYIKEPDIALALKKLNGLRVLCAIREGEQGLYALNRKIERYLQKQKLLAPGAEFYEHRPVMITRNYYDLELFNGDIGIIRSDESGLKAWFADGDNVRPVLPGFIADCETVFAMTIHKSQGSEYNKVLVVLPDNANLPLLTAELLYTGVTRARDQVYVQVSQTVLEQSAQRRVQRASGIVDRLRE